MKNAIFANLFAKARRHTSIFKRPAAGPLLGLFGPFRPLISFTFETNSWQLQAFGVAKRPNSFTESCVTCDAVNLCGQVSESEVSFTFANLDVGTAGFYLD